MLLKVSTHHQSISFRHPRPLAYGKPPLYIIRSSCPLRGYPPAAKRKSKDRAASSSLVAKRKKKVLAKPTPLVANVKIKDQPIGPFFQPPCLRSMSCPSPPSKPSPPSTPTPAARRPSTRLSTCCGTETAPASRTAHRVGSGSSGPCATPKRRGPSSPAPAPMRSWWPTWPRWPRWASCPRAR
jgi:hypothetical protein